MNVLYFHQHFSTPKGAAGQRSYEMAQRLLLRGHQVTMICGSYQVGYTGLDMPFKKGMRQGHVDGIHVIEFDLAYSNHDGFLKRSFTFLKFAIRTIKFIFTLKYDVVFATSTPLSVGIPGIIARWLKRKPFVFEVRDLWPELPKAMGVITNPFVLLCLSIIERASYYSANALIGLSPGIVAGIAKCGISKENITMVSNGCDIDLFQNVTASARPVGVGDSDLMVVYTGTHGIANGLNAVLDAACELKRRGRSDIKLILMGQGKLKPSIQARVKQEGLDSVLLLDPLPKNKLAEFMASADLGLQILSNIPAFYEGTSPNKFFDYIASGLPVLINYPGWLAEKIHVHDCGFIVSPENCIHFADMLEEAARDKNRLKAMGERALQLAKTEFDRKILSETWVNIIETAMVANKIGSVKVLD
jgi:glycosyltransferase involved in cell wall biosynthesis